jgi:hypothetical protein
VHIAGVVGNQGQRIAGDLVRCDGGGPSPDTKPRGQAGYTDDTFRFSCSSQAATLAVLATITKPQPPNRLVVDPAV